MDDQKQQLIDRLKQAQNILVTVSTNPSVDQLAAAIGLTIVLNHLGKHATAVFSGEVPNTLEFLKPEETLEKNTDSLRDFIIALDKSKADKLRYKVEDQVVRIFITPYKTSISEKDLDFSQGDFNVDVVVALGVREQQDLDGAITAHGRILHDATVASISTDAGNALGSINWVDPSASSLSELVLGLADVLDKKAVDSQVATALLTGIVATTERFRNDKTSPKTMSASAELMAAGANQQLIATELEHALEVQQTPEQGGEEDQPPVGPVEEEKPKPEPGTLEIEHNPDEDEHHETAPEAAEPETPPETPQPQVQVDEEGKFTTLSGNKEEPEISAVRGVSSADQPTAHEESEVNHDRLTGPAKQTGNLTANTVPEGLDPDTEELTLPPLETPMLSHNDTVLSPPTSEPPAPLQPAPQDWQPPQPPATNQPDSSQSQPPSQITADETLAEIEKAVDSPHVHADDTPKPQTEPTASVDDARDAVDAAYSRPGASTDPLQPIAALNAQPLGQELHDEVSNEQPSPSVADPFGSQNAADNATGQASVPPLVTNTGFSEPTPGNSPADQTLDMPLPASPFTPPTPGSTEQFQNPQQFPPASAFPGAPQADNGQSNGPTAPPPVPPPMLPPMQ